MGERRSTAAAIKSRVKNRWLMAQCLWVSSMLGALTSVRAAPVPAAITLVGQRVALDETKGELTVEVTVQNHLEVALAAVEVGWLLAPHADALAAVTDPGALYLAADDPKHAVAPPGVLVLRRSVNVAVAANATALASFEAPLAGEAPAVYRTHVLGYALADASLPLLLRLLNGSAAADERAAVDFFALAGTAEERRAARARLEPERWLDQLEPRLTAAVPQRPSATELHERLFIVRAVGVVGGERGERLLTSMRDRADLAALDELLRVTLIDRLRGNPLETPLAFAAPPGAKSFRDVVEVALADARVLKADTGTVAAQVPASDGQISATASRLPTADDPLPADAPAPAVRPFDLREQLLGLAVVVAAAVITLWLLRRNK